ncbi:PD-(D/E)XK motif protein [Brevundimonas sp.]|uniref:PD-(D/E)XK motif protein n=1 Tax=Brevundimonas sp. TaxID=1871086 RepID=UPI003BAADCFE
MSEALRSLRADLLQELLPEQGTIIAFSLDEMPVYHLGRTPEGFFCAFVEAPGGVVDYRLKSLEIRQGVRCRLRHPGGGERETTGSLIVCRTTQDALIDLFVRLYADAIVAFGPCPSANDLVTWLHQLATLLSRAEQDGRKRLQGLWAELVVIRELGDPDLLIRRWRPDPSEAFDFLACGFALEVKSCRDFSRVHTYSWNQLRPPEGLDVWVASLVVRRDPQGVSVLDLLADIEDHLLDPELRHLVRAITLATAGSLIEEDDDYRFDAALACDSLKLFSIEAVPAVGGVAAPEVVSITVQTRCDGLVDIGSSAEACARLSAGP